MTEPKPDQLATELRTIVEGIERLRAENEWIAKENEKWVTRSNAMEAENARLQAEIAASRRLDELAAGECLVAFPQPTEDGAKLLRSNRMLMTDLAAARADQAAMARRELEHLQFDLCCPYPDAYQLVCRRLAALPAQQPKPEPAAEAFRDAAKNCTGEMFGEQAAVKPAAEPQVEPVALEVVAEKAAEWLTLCSHNDDKNSGTHSKVAHALRAAIRPVTGNMHPVLYWLDDGKFARAMLVAQSGLGGHLVVDLTTGDGPSVIGMPDWWDAGYVAAYGGLVPECASEGKEPGQWSYGVAQLPSYTVAQQPEPEPAAFACATCEDSGTVEKCDWPGEHANRYQEPCPDCKPKPDAAMRDDEVLRQEVIDVDLMIQPNQTARVLRELCRAELGRRALATGEPERT